MHYASVVAFLGLSASLITAIPVESPTANGWSNHNAQRMKAIQNIAGGTLSNAAPPPNPGPDGITNLQLIAFNEYFEVAFFNSLLANITNRTPGYELKGYDHEYIIDSFNAILAQEELHQLNANLALAKFGAEPLKPCKYTFPSDDFASAMALAATFTDVVLGTLQDVQQVFADHDASGLVRAVGSVIGNEGEQNGFFRTLQGKRPSSAPFLTTNVRDFAFSALLQTFIVPGSCPNSETIQLTEFAPLKITSKPVAKSSQISFEVSETDNVTVNSSFFITYISGVNTPVSVPVKNIVKKDKAFTFQADFPFDQGFSDGLTVAALTKCGDFATADDVAKKTVAGPGLIELN